MSLSFSYSPTKSFFLCYILILVVTERRHWSFTWLVSAASISVTSPRPVHSGIKGGEGVCGEGWFRLPTAPYPHGQRHASALPSTLPDAPASGASPVQVPSENTLLNTFPPTKP